ncbi:MAG: hypothetical protein CFE26_06205 [Verrucomicrobiales bacterium VVV1]|nr:MAG: hypothetical protein CFE26_06205 [Verrucomicrobiales bacterium VVV1]
MVPSYQMTQDAEHLKLLAIFYYVSSGLSCLGCFFGIFYAGMGLMIPKMAASAPRSPGVAPFPEEMTWMFLLVGIVIIVISLVMAVGSFLTARWLSARKNKTFCMVIAGFSCLSIPLGTALGVFTFIVLSRPSVSRLFEDQSPLTTPHA